MLVQLLSIVTLIATSAALGLAQPAADSKDRNSWELGSTLSLAGAMHAQNIDKSLVERRFALAAAAASKAGIRLPALPARTGRKVDDSATVLNYLLNVTGSPIGNILAKNNGAENAAIFEIALKSNILLMLYSPGDSTSNAIAGVIRKRRSAAGLPSGMTDPLLQLLDTQAGYEQVKAELFRLHETAPPFIAILEYGRVGERLYAEQDYAGSAAQFANAIALDPDGPDHYFSRARAHLRLGKHADAIADYTKVLELRKSSPSVERNLPVIYHNRGLSYSLAGRHALAISDLTMAIKLRPEYASAYKVRGLVYKTLGNAKLSALDFAKAEELQPGITK